MGDALLQRVFIFLDEPLCCQSPIIQSSLDGIGIGSNIRKMIYRHEQRQYKQVYLTDYETEHGEIAVPSKWDMPTYIDYKPDMPFKL